MHTIALKSDNEFFNMLNDMVKSLDKNRSNLIRKAVVHYRNVLEQEKLKIQIKKASMKVRQESLNVSKEFSSALNDGLDKWGRYSIWLKYANFFILEGDCF